MFTINLFNGLVYGALLIVMCSGLALIYGLRRVVNFAHGSLYMLGAYIGYSVAGFANFWAALVVAPLVMALFGVLLAAYRIGVIVVGATVALGLTLWLRYSRVGLFVRAASTDPTTTAMQGINTDALSAGVVGLGTALAGLAGVVAAPFLSLSPSMSADVIIDSFVVVVIGGLGSLGGAFAAAMLLGMVQAIGAVYLPDAAVLMPFALMVAILIWKPSGFAGSRT